MKKRCISAVLCLCTLLAALCGCAPAGGGADFREDPSASSLKEEAPPGNSSESTTYEIALVTDLGTINDSSFNQSIWLGVKRYAQENSLTYRFYQPDKGTTDAYLATINLAIGYGAKVVVCPGYLFEVPVFTAQELHPDVRFILVDAIPHNASYTHSHIGKNATCILSREEQPGFLAGYSAVCDGYTNLGFLGGMAVPAVIRYGYGFVQGADLAARERGKKVSVRYHYMGDFVASPEATAIASSWYQHSTDVIFFCGGAGISSVITAAEANGGLVIGADVDQSALSKTILTSAMKPLTRAIYHALSASYNGSFPGGTSTTLALENDGVGLPMATSRFRSFSPAQYKAIVSRLQSGRIQIQSGTDDSTTADLRLTNTKVEYIN